jgi:hypothetical protein
MEEVSHCHFFSLSLSLQVCGECDREDRMLLCDGCDLGYHLECLDPPMDTVPLEEWFCPDCALSSSVQIAEEVATLLWSLYVSFPMLAYSHLTGTIFK